MKTCTACCATKPLTEFYRQPHGKFGVRAQCKTCSASANAKWQSGNRAKRNATAKQYRGANAEKHQKLCAEWHQRNASAVRARNKAWQEQNQADVNAANAKRRCSRISRTPKWLTSDQLDAIKLRYKEARALTRMTGVKHNVDHIVPLQGKTVSGLHVPWNLRVIPARDNARKKNRFA